MGKQNSSRQQSVVVQRKVDGKFLTPSGRWSKDLSRAQTWASRDNAIRHCIMKELKEVELFLRTAAPAQAG